MANKFAAFMNDIKIELKKVSWSSRAELIGSTIVVLVSVAFLTIFIGLCDIALSRVVTIIMARF